MHPLTRIDGLSVMEPPSAHWSSVRAGLRGACRLAFLAAVLADPRQSEAQPLPPAPPPPPPAAANAPAPVPALGPAPAPAPAPVLSQEEQAAALLRERYAPLADAVEKAELSTDPKRLDTLIPLLLEASKAGIDVRTTTPNNRILEIGPDAAPALVTSLRGHPDPDVRENVLCLLRGLSRAEAGRQRVHPPPSIVPFADLHASLRDPDPEVRASVVRSLIELRDDRAGWLTEALLQALHDPHPDVHHAALEYFRTRYWERGLPEQRIAPLIIKALEDPRCRERRDLYKTLFLIDRKRALAVVLRHLHHPDTGWSAAEALAEAFPKLQEDEQDAALKDSTGLLGNAREKRGQLSAAFFLGQAVATPRREGISLPKEQGTSASEILADVLRSRPAPSPTAPPEWDQRTRRGIPHHDRMAREHAMSSLSRLGPEALPSLRKILQDPTHSSGRTP